jgi:hypothetical protein
MANKSKLREAAKLAGLQKFQSDSDCRKGHLSPMRYTANSKCVLCALAFRKNYYEKNIDRERLNGVIYGKKYYAENAEKIKPKVKEYSYQKYHSDIENQRLVKREQAKKTRSDPIKLERINKGYRAKYRKNHKDLACAERALRRCREKQRTVSWANLEKIKQLYREARKLTEETGVPHHVDHIIPLQGKLVSGLHVENNLRVIPAKENISKHNRFEIE